MMTLAENSRTPSGRQQKSIKATCIDQVLFAGALETSMAKSTYLFVQRRYELSYGMVTHFVSAEKG